MNTLDSIINAYVKSLITTAFAQQLGNHIELKIRQRTLSGFDKDNQPFKAYSTRPFALPAAAITKTLRKKLAKQELLTYIKRNGKLFAVVLGGYAKYKQLMYSKTSYDGTVNLTATGAMMRSFMVTKADTKEIRIGFTRKQAAAVYVYNAMRGRDLLGITANELTDAFDETIAFNKANNI